jgi:lipoprotein-releasing system permease protein
MKYPFFFAMRHLETKRRSTLVSRITSIAVGGVFVGVMALVIVLSVLNGFETELRSRILLFNTDLFVFARDRWAWSRIDSVAAELQKREHVVATAPFVRSEAILAYRPPGSSRTRLRGVVVKGVDPLLERRVSSVIDSVQPALTDFDASFFEDEEPHLGLVLGLDLAMELGVGFGDEIALVTAPATFEGDRVEPEAHPARVIGFFKSGLYDFDSRFVYMDLGDADSLLGTETGLRGLSVKLDDPYRAQEVDFELASVLPLAHFGTNNWIAMNRNLFTYMKIEKILMFLMLTLIIFVAAFNLVGMLTMVVMEKRREIGILKSMGASGRGIMSIFMLEGLFVGVLGTMGGLVTGWVVCWILDRIRIDLPGDVYFIETLPVRVEGLDLLLVSAAAVIICFLATLYPSWEASRLVPVEAIRSE